jgi:RNA polymerase sigma factor (TIGR02999 family)
LLSLLCDTVDGGTAVNVIDAFALPDLTPLWEPLAAAIVVGHNLLFDAHGLTADFALPAGPRRVHSTGMSNVTRLLEAAAAGNRRASADLLPLVYDELRMLAAARMAAENPGNTLDATALVHEAYVRLVGSTDENRWDGRGHFFSAAAEAMRRVLVDRARGKARSKRGGDRRRIPLADIPGRVDRDPHLLLTLDDALTRLATEDVPAADVAKLRLFAGLTVEQAATTLGVSRATAYRNWTYARAWLQMALGEKP